MDNAEITEALHELSAWAKEMDGMVHKRAGDVHDEIGHPSHNGTGDYAWDVVFHLSPSVSGMFALFSRCLHDAAWFNQEIGKGIDVDDNRGHLSDAMHFALRQWRAAGAALCILGRMFNTLGVDEPFPAPPWTMEHGEDDIFLTRNTAGEGPAHVHGLH